MTVRRPAVVMLLALSLAALSACTASPDPGTDAQANGPGEEAGETPAAAAPSAGELRFEGPLTHGARLFANDRQLLLWLPPLLDDDGVVWVPLESVVQGLGGAAALEGGAATVAYDGRELALDAGSDQAQLDDAPRTLPGAPFLAEPGYLMVPLLPLLELFQAGARIGVHGDLYLTLEGDLPSPAAGLEVAVVDAEGEPVPDGLVVLEAGLLEQGTPVRGGALSDGAFVITVPAAGPFGLHVYAWGYACHGEQLVLAAGQTRRVEVTLAPLEPVYEPPLLGPPSVVRARFGDRQRPGLVMGITATLPSGVLARPVLAVGAASGEVLPMLPPSPGPNAAPGATPYPTGRYELEYVAPPGEEPSERWYFVTASREDGICVPANIRAWSADDDV